MIKFRACPQCRKMNQFAVSQCPKCGYGVDDKIAPSPEVEAAAAALLAVEDEPSPFADAVPTDLFE